MSANLLLNGSFEEGWYLRDGVPELQIPDDWLFDFADVAEENPIDPAPWSRPEVRVFPRKDLPLHEQDLFVLEGDYTLKIFKGNGAFFCRLSQEIELQPGTYRLTVNVFADLIKGYEDDDSKIWADDPNGRDGLIRLSGWLSLRDWDSLTPGKWNIKTFELNVKGSSALAHVAIGIDFMCPFPLANSGLFCDAWTLERIEEAPEPEPGRGQPRVQYARTYNVIPETATAEQAIAIFVEGWERQRETTGGSYDDGGIGNLDDRGVNLYGILPDLRSEFDEFYETYYPGVGISFLSIPGEEPPPPPPLKPLGELLTLHLQTPVPGWLDYVAAVKPGWVKLIGNFEAARDIKRVSPETKVLIRHHDDDNAKYLNNPDKTLAAALFLGRFWDALLTNAPWIDAVEGLNETIATGDMAGIEKAVEFEVAFAEILGSWCEHVSIEGVVPCLLNTAVGNPQHGYETAKLVPAVEAAIQYGGYISYHNYFPAHVIHAERWLEEEGYHHHMRALLSWDETFAKHGLKPKYLFTESGAIGMTVRPDGRPGTYDPDAGWRAALDGDLDRYVNLLVRFSDMVNEWNVEHDNRAEAIMLFTSGVGIGWPNFLLGEREFVALAEVL